MPQKCFFKPIRSHRRPYTASDAARVMCYAIEARTDLTVGAGGGSRQKANLTFEQAAAEIVALAKARCGPEGSSKFEIQAEVARQALADEAGTEFSALEAVYGDLVKNSALFLQLLEWFGALLTFLTILLTVARFVPVPQVRLIAAGAQRVLTRVAFFQGAIIARKAANDATILTIKETQEILKAARALRQAA